jgi:hypothetical protein
MSNGCNKAIAIAIISYIQKFSELPEKPLSRGVEYGFLEGQLW